ncbi:flagellar motor switch protein FliM [Desulfurobacterium thermolithotrophum DSM 11699]|uniref:Flagellar motor switch protein FliM n=1 Tax=Desulfurobacterium thermolithotrophum (strain DSM 11699 / BSA) TaxID=868864 RepID=F0S0P8_DESTD|nr:flagellar motor switch protein FliM [Desulfurobacterium thermolithotrophum]ADY73851.1 flagellar motor switch protein FliM [Desulfurobacterium thermolithotrophum DSM 11699]
MSEEFLSQEEIDALLGGDSNSSSEEQKLEVAPFDFSLVEHIKKGGVPGLELLLERWIKIYSEEIRRLVPQINMVTKESVYITRFNNFMSKIPLPASYSIVSMKPLKDNFLLVLDSRLVFVVISVMFGGPAQPFKIEGREFTKLETRIIDDIVKISLSTFQHTWKDVYPVEFELKSIELNPALARIVSGNDRVIVVECTMDVDGYEAPFFFCFPQGMFLPIKELIFSEAVFAEKDPVWEKHLTKKLLKTELKLTLELTRKNFFLRELLSWKEGDEILLDISKDEFVKLYVEDKPKFWAKLGKIKDKYAALVVDMINGENNGGKREKSGTEPESGREKSGRISQGMGGSS